MNKKIKALFCGGYVLEDGTVVIEEPEDNDEEFEEEQDLQENKGEEKPGEGG